MPVIKIREETEQVVYPASGQSNAAVIPLFVTSIGIKDGKYYKADLRPTKFSKVGNFEEYCNDFAVRDPEGIFTDKNYYMAKDLISRGLEILVKPIDISSDTLFKPTIHEEVNPETNRPETVFDEDNAAIVPLLSWVTTDSSDFNELIPSGLDMAKPEDRFNYRTGASIVGEEVGQIDLRPRVNFFDASYFPIPEDVKPECLTNYADFARAIQYLIGEGFYNELRDRNRFNFKFMTTGAYENILPGEDVDSYDYAELVTMINLCEALKEVDAGAGRGDALVLLDFPADITKKDDKIYNAINYIGNEAYPDTSAEKWKFGVCTYPWVIKKFTKEGIGGVYGKVPMELTGSYAYLKAFADFVYADEANRSLDYMAIAGYARGKVGDMKDCTPVEDIGEIDMHIFQNDSFSQGYNGEPTLGLTINPIIKCQDDVYRIWGNRVMLPLPVDEEGNIIYADKVKDCNYFLNVRQMVCDIKKECFYASSKVSFEPNDDVTWFNFKSIVNPLLDNMVLNRGMEWYSWKRLPADAKGLMKAQLTIKPIEAVESFDITVFIRNTDEQ